MQKSQHHLVGFIMCIDTAYTIHYNEKDRKHGHMFFEVTKRKCEIYN